MWILHRSDASLIFRLVDGLSDFLSVEQFLLDYAIGKEAVFILVEIDGASRAIVED